MTGALEAITSLIKNKPPGDRLAREAMIYVVRIWPLIIAVPKGGVELAEYVENPQVMTSPILETAVPVGLVRMRPSVRRFIVHDDIVKEVMPGIEEVSHSEGSIQYRWAQIHFHGPKGNQCTAILCFS